MFILTIVVAFVVLIFVAFEFSIIVTYGMPIKKRKLDELMLKLEVYHLNTFDETILSCPVSPYITTVLYRYVLNIMLTDMELFGGSLNTQKV